MKYIILNHKMNLLYEDLPDYIKRTNNIKKNLIIAPSNIYLLEFLKNSCHQISSQDVCYIENGNHTGKVSWSQLKSLGIKYSLIGHSEKKDDIIKINAKVKACLDNDITPILCFGNQESSEPITKILDQIEYYNDKIIYAYEPVYNIGKKDISLIEIRKNIDIIDKYLRSKMIKNPHILYGGGINKENINEIYHLDKLSGILLGSISSDISNLENLLTNIDEK